MKYIAALILITVMGVIISIIDAQSTDAAGSHRAGDLQQAASDRICAMGIVEGATQEVELRVEQFGRVREILVVEGQWVESGTVLVRLDSERQQQEVALASARLEIANAELERLTNGARSEERDEATALAHVAEARLEQATRNLKLMEQLRRERAVTQQEADDQVTLVDATRSELEAARARAGQLEAPARADEMRAAAARVAAAEAELNLAKISASKTELQAPCRGCVLQLHAEPGELAGPDAIQPLVVLADTSTIRVRAFVEELDAPRVRMGMPARVSVDGLPGTEFPGRVVAVSPCMDSRQPRIGRSRELFDQMTREIIVELTDGNVLLNGLRVDVMLERSPENS